MTCVEISFAYTIRPLLVLRHFYGLCVAAAMATGDASVTKGHVSQLQPSTKLHQSSFEPEPTRTKGEKSDT